MRHPKRLLIPLLLFMTPLARADGLQLDVGPARGDTITDPQEYARTLQHELFSGKHLAGVQIEAAYQLSFRSKDSFPSFFIFGLGYVSASLEDSYGGGRLKLERKTTLGLLGYRLQYESLAPNLVLGAELMMAKGLAGEVTLDAPTGRESYEEDYDLFTLTVPTLTATAGYRLTPSLLVNAKLRVASRNVPNFLLGVTYDLEHP